MRIFITIFIISLLIGCSEKRIGDWRQEFIDQEKSRINTLAKSYDFDSGKYVLRYIDSSFNTYNEKGQLLGIDNKFFCRYDSTGKLIEEVFCLRDCENPGRELYFYDNLNRLIRTEMVFPDDKAWVLEQYFYNNQNLLVREVYGIDSTPTTITYTYDSLSRKTTETKHEFNDNVDKWFTYVDSLFYDKNNNVILKKGREIGLDLLKISKLTYKDSLLVTRVDTAITSISTYLPTPTSIHHALFFREEYRYNLDNKLIERTIFQPDYKTPYCKMTYEYK